MQPYNYEAILQTTKPRDDEIRQSVSGYTYIKQSYDFSFPIFIADFKNLWNVYCISDKTSPSQASWTLEGQYLPVPISSLTFCSRAYTPLVVLKKRWFYPQGHIATSKDIPVVTVGD